MHRPLPTLALAAALAALSTGCARDRVTFTSLGGAGEKAVLPPLPPVPYDLNRPYPLVPGDWISIKVLDKPELNCDIPILPDGKIELWESDVGGGPRQTIRAAGLTPLELQEQVTQVYARTKFEKRPYVIVTVQSAVPRTVNIVGAVKVKEGAITLPPNGRLTLLRAIYQAGGPADNADMASVRISRKDPVTGAEVSLPPYDLDEMQRLAAYDRDPPLEPGDIVTVLPLGKVAIWGSVNQPGEYLCPRGMTVTRLFTAAGGLKEFADYKDVRVIRDEGTTRQSAQSVNAKAILAGTAADFRIFAGDRVYVGERIW